MATLILQRILECKNVKDLKGKTENSTIGTLTLKSDDSKVLFSGFTCENDGPSTDTAMQDKRIIAREYNLEWTQTSKNANKTLGKWQNKAILLTCDGTLPNFRNRRILIHVGNFPTDTEGCILVGISKSDKGCVNSSVNAIIKLFDAIDKIGINSVKLTILEVKSER